MDRSKWPAKAVLPIAMPGVKFVAAAILITGMFFYFGWAATGWVSLGLTCFTGWFFRDPDRVVPEGDDLMVSPADGRVIHVQRLAPCEYVEEPCQKVSIFMNVFNVHVNRIPLDGVVDRVKYHPGRFVNASLDKASAHNERNAVTVRTQGGSWFVFVQVAGLIARRIVNGVSIGDRVKKGERYGMIQFGSRLDLYLPLAFDISVAVGDRTRAGETIIGRMH